LFYVDSPNLVTWRRGEGRREGRELIAYIYALPAGQRWKQAAAAALMLLYIGRRLHARRMTATRGHLPGN